MNFRPALINSAARIRREALASWPNRRRISYRILKLIALVDLFLDIDVKREDFGQLRQELWFNSGPSTILEKRIFNHRTHSFQFDVKRLILFVEQDSDNPFFPGQARRIIVIDFNRFQLGGCGLSIKTSWDLGKIKVDFSAQWKLLNTDITLN